MIVPTTSKIPTKLDWQTMAPSLELSTNYREKISEMVNRSTPFFLITDSPTWRDISSHSLSLIEIVYIIICILCAITIALSICYCTAYQRLQLDFGRYRRRWARRGQLRSTRSRSNRTTIPIST